MKTKFMLGFGVLALAVASAASINVDKPTWIGGTELKPGQYKVEVAGDKAVLKNGKQVVEVPAKVETGSQTYSDTSVIRGTADGKTKIEEIRVGGTNTKLVFKSATSANGSE